MGLEIGDMIVLFFFILGDDFVFFLGVFLFMDFFELMLILELVCIRFEGGILSEIWGRELGCLYLDEGWVVECFVFCMELRDEMVLGLNLFFFWLVGIFVMIGGLLGGRWDWEFLSFFCFVFVVDLISCWGFLGWLMVFLLWWGEVVIRLLDEWDCCGWSLEEWVIVWRWVGVLIFWLVCGFMIIFIGGDIDGLFFIYEVCVIFFRVWFLVVY